MRVPMTAKRGFVYAGHNYRAGQEFEAHSESNARFLVQVGHAERAPKVAPAPTYQTRMMVAAPVLETQRSTVIFDDDATWPESPGPAGVHGSVGVEGVPGAPPVKRGPGRPRTKKTDE